MKKSEEAETDTPRTLLLPAKSDIERDKVAAAWQSSIGPVVHLNRFWDRPNIAPATARLYGNDTFCLVVAQLLGLDLVSPPDDFLINLDEKWLGRTVDLAELGAINGVTFPRFVKPLVPKQFTAGVFDNVKALARETDGLGPSTLLQISDVVTIQAEARCFVLGEHCVSASFFEGSGDSEHARRFVESLAKEVDLPETVVLDVGIVEDELVVVEANATWGAGLNGCDPQAAVVCLDEAARPG